MKVIIGFLVFVCVTTITIRLAVSKRIDGKMTLLFLGFAIASGFIAGNHDMIKHIKFGGEGVEIETAKREISSAKSAVRRLLPSRRSMQR